MKQNIYETFDGIKIIHVSGEVTPDFWEEVPHSHDHNEIFVHLCGELDIFVEKNLYHLSGGEIRIYRSNELHCGKTDKKQYMEWYQISIPYSFFKTPRNKDFGRILFEREAGKENVFISKRNHELAELLKEAESKKGEFSKHYLYCAVLKLLCIINEADSTVLDVGENPILSKLTNAVNTNFRELSSVEELGHMTHYSTSYINKVFKRHLNITPHRFIIEKKLSEAKNALMNGLDVSEACDAAGFNDCANFITLFKKYFGTTPKKWAKAHAMR